MDKLTQGNAASAEESASASEQLSAQSGEMLIHIKQLMKVVEGSSKALTRHEANDTIQ